MSPAAGSFDRSGDDHPCRKRFGNSPDHGPDRPRSGETRHTTKESYDNSQYGDPTEQGSHSVIGLHAQPQFGCE